MSTPVHTDDTQSIAHLAERFLQRTALGVLLLAVVYAMAAAMYLVQEPLLRSLDFLQTVLALLAMAIVLPGFVRMMRLRLQGDCDSLEADSYMGEVFRKACVAAFSATFVLLTLTGPLSKRLPAELPTDFYIQAVLALSLGAFSATFFTVLWRDREQSDD